MLIKHDEKFVNHKLIEMGYATKGIHSFIFDRYFTEEEMEENRMFSEQYGTSSQEWSDRCDNTGRKINKQLQSIMDVLEKEFKIYQYKDNELKYGEHDLYFYSNKGWNGQDYYDYMTLSFNDKNSEERNKEIFEKLNSLLEEMTPKNIKCRIQYQTIKNTKVIESKGIEICKRLKEKMIEYSGMIGKIKCVNEENQEYIFMKKGTRKYGYNVSFEKLILNFE